MCQESISRGHCSLFYFYASEWKHRLTDREYVPELIARSCSGHTYWCNQGFLRVTGRIKELIITQGGKNIAPVPIEDVIKSKLPKIVSNVMVVGDGQKFLSCLITLQVTTDPKVQGQIYNRTSSSKKWTFWLPIRQWLQRGIWSQLLSPGARKFQGVGRSNPQTTS